MRPFSTPARAGAAKREGNIAASWPTLARIGAILWLVATAIAALMSAIAITTATSLWPLVPGNLVTPVHEQVGLALNVVLAALACSSSIVVGYRSARYWRRVLCAVGCAPLLLTAALSGRIVACAVAAALVIPVALAGRRIAAYFLAPEERAAAWVVGVALGFGLLGLGGLAIGVLGLLRAPLLWALLGILMVFGIVRWRTAILDDARVLGAWFVTPQRPQSSLLLGVGLLVGFAWIYWIGALTPETATDATWQRLATAAQFAHRGDLALADPELTVARHPALGEIIYGVGLTLGPVAVAKILHFGVGCCCAVAVLLLGRRLGGTSAGMLGALIFFTMPLVGWLAQIAFLDLFLALFALAAAICIAVGRMGSPLQAVSLGALVALGVAVKLHFAYVALGIFVILGLTLLAARGWRGAFRALAIATLSAFFTAIPFILRSVVLSGTLPGLALGTQALQRRNGEQLAIMGDLNGFGVGRSLLDFLALPFDLTMRSYRFEINPTPSGPFGGMVAYLVFAALPLIFFVRPRRPVLIALSGIVAALACWFMTAQYLRYALSIIALLCPLAGAAFIAVDRALREHLGRTAFRIALVLLIGAGLLVQLRVPTLGWRFATGQEDEATYLRQYVACCSGYTALELLAYESSATRILASAGTARLYSPVRVSTVFMDLVDLDLYADEQTILAQLVAGQFSHILVARQGYNEALASMPVFRHDFLSRNTILLGGDARGYLYRIVPPGQQSSDWTTGDELLEGTWISEEIPQLATDQSWTSQATVTANQRYLFRYTTRTMNATDGQVLVTITWHDAAGHPLGTATQSVRALQGDPRGDVMVGLAPALAASAVITVEATRGAVRLSNLSFRQMAMR